MIEWIITSSALILLVVILRVLIKNQVSPRLRYALWGLVLLRLLVPVSLWESQTSVMTPVAAQEVYQDIERIPRYVRERPDGWVEIGHPTRGNHTAIPPESETVRTDRPDVYQWYDPEETVSLTELKKQVSVRDAFLWTWLAGIAAVGAFLLAVNLRFDRMLKKKRRTLEQYRGRWVFSMEGLATPCLFGLFRPGIYLPPEVAEDEAAREHVLAHEYAHFRQGDHVWAVLRGVCLAVHWYNPLVWLAAYLSRRDCELSCDEGAVRLLGENRRADYGRTLVGLVARRTTPKDLACCATTMTGGRSALKERVALLVKRPRTTAWMACVVGLACIVFAVCTFTGAAAEEAEPNEPDAPVEVQPTEEPADEPAPDRDLLVQGAVSELVYDFQENYRLTELWIDPDMGETPGPSYLLLDWIGPSAVLEVNSWVLKTGGRVECSLDAENYDYFGWDGSGTLTVHGEARYVDCPIKETLPLRYRCTVTEQTDGVILSPGTLFSAVPEDLPTELMDLTRPAEEQGTWLLLAKCPTSDNALYRGAWDDQHVYLRTTNQCFQRFDRDLSGMELLPTMDNIWGSDADMTVQVLYRRYEGTYFNGTSYEPAIVAEEALYEWSGAYDYWTESYASTQPVRLTEDVPALADLPTRLVSPGTPEVEADIWLIGELRSENIAVYWERSTNKYWLRYGSAIQTVEGVAVCMPQMLLPELHFDGQRDDGKKVLTAIYTNPSGEGMGLSAYEWDGETWKGGPYELVMSVIEGFNNSRLFQFYDDGMAYISYRYEELLLDLRDLWERGYWDSEPDVCALSESLINYTYQDGKILLQIGGEILDTGGHFLHGYTFQYDCLLEYYDTAFGSILFSHLGEAIHSDFEVQPDPPELSDPWREVLRATLEEAGENNDSVYAVHDINGDGVEELLVRWMPEGGVSSSWGTTVYDVNGTERLHGYGQPDFYDNGAVAIHWSHNQGPSIAIWPYDLYVNSGTGRFRYTEVGHARARSDDAPDFEKVAYADLDGDGMVYYIGEDAYTEDNPVDNDVYEAWRDQYLRDAKVLPIMYFPLTEDAVS